jgi:hypothetical protein
VRYLALASPSLTPAAKVEMMREKGDKDGADVWLRIIVAITHAGRAAG